MISFLVLPKTGLFYRVSPCLVLWSNPCSPYVSHFEVHPGLRLPKQVMLQRNVIDVSGSHGALTIGKLPDGIDNSSLTWVPVRLYEPGDGGLSPPTFAQDEVGFPSL